MTCEDCGCDRLLRISNYLTCTGCGLMTDYVPVYITSYSNPQVPRRRQYYSRCKRFRNYIRKMKSEILGAAMEQILDLYSNIEFFWSSQKENRKYFFSRKVILFFIVHILELEVDVPVLKDEERTATQLKSINTVFEVSQKYGV